MSVAVDGITQVKDLSATNPITFNHTCSGHDRYLIVGISSRSGGATVSSVTYGGVAMTALGTAANLSFSVMFMYGLVNPPGGTNQVSVTMSAVSQIVIAAVCFNGVAQTSSTGTFASATGTNAAPSVNVTSATGELVVDTLAHREASPVTTVTVGAGQFQIWQDNTGATTADILGAGSTEPGAATVTMSWTATASARWAIGGISLRPAATRNNPWLGTEIG